jgi:hypothetical protein
MFYMNWINKMRLIGWEDKMGLYESGFYTPVKINPSAPGYEHRFVWPK